VVKLYSTAIPVSRHVAQEPLGASDQPIAHTAPVDDPPFAAGSETSKWPSTSTSAASTVPKRSTGDATPLERRVMNLAIFERIEVGPEAEIIGTKLAPVYELYPPGRPASRPATAVRGTLAALSAIVAGAVDLCRLSRAGRRVGRGFQPSLERTVRYLQSVQSEDGGFSGSPAPRGRPPRLQRVDRAGVCRGGDQPARPNPAGQHCVTTTDPMPALLAGHGVQIACRP
jgi:hypothetical protein